MARARPSPASSCGSAAGPVDSDGPHLLQWEKQNQGWVRGVESQLCSLPDVTSGQALTSHSLNRGDPQDGGRGLDEVTFAKSLPHSRDLTDVGFFSSLSWAPLLPVRGLTLSISRTFWCSTSMGWKVNTL